MRNERVPMLAVLLALIAAPAVVASCRAPSAAPPTPRGSCVLDVNEAAGDDGAIRAVLKAEADRMVAQDIDGLMVLWGEGSRVVNAKNTPLDDSDDQIWLDKDAVRHRYVRTVFPGNPQAAAPASLEITLDGERAIVSATTNIGSEVSPSGDQWLLERNNGCWVIQQLTYNLEPPTP
jgi:hypothetical protein